MSNEIRPEVNDPDGVEFTPELQEQVGDGADEQPGADGAPRTEDYEHDPGTEDDDSDDDAEGGGVGIDDDPEGEDDPA